MSKPCRTCGEVFPLTSYHKEQRNKDGRKTDCPPCRAKESAKRKEARTGQTTPGRAGRPKGSGSASPDVLAALRSSGTAVSDDDWADILGHIVKRAREGHPGDIATIAKLRLLEQAEGAAVDPAQKATRDGKLLRLGIRLIRDADPGTFYDRGLAFLDEMVSLGPEGAAKALGIYMEEFDA